MLQNSLFCPFFIDFNPLNLLYNTFTKGVITMFINILAFQEGWKKPVKHHVTTAPLLSDLSQLCKLLLEHKHSIQTRIYSSNPKQLSIDTVPEEQQPVCFENHSSVALATCAKNLTLPHKLINVLAAGPSRNLVCKLMANKSLAELYFRAIRRCVENISKRLFYVKAQESK
ncbi:hypothetical protein [Pontibacter harenae]|uniref:hypothetical protein n=1 Tax=Pontibacter harenae TaxID=2894083 RepID=UPI001E58C1EB|nr:hypothetical protein [Pontibacter harenae]MCC9167323.1 hypothetical protein [Pontibacter harenae]